MTTPRSLSPAVAEARAAVQRHGTVGSIPHLQDLWAKHPDEPDIEAYIFLGRLWQGEAETVEALVRQRIGAQPTPGYLGAGSIIAQYLGDLDAVTFRSKLGNELDADHFLMLWSEIQRYQMLGETAKAMALCERSLEIYPEDPEVFAATITATKMGSSTQEAKALLESAPDWFKKSGEWQAKMGTFALADRQLTIAEEHFRLAVADHPSSSIGWAHLAMALRFQGKVAEAEQAADIALGINPRMPIALMQKAALAADRGQTAEANEFKQRAAVAIPALADQQKLQAALELKRKADTKGSIRQLRELADHGSAPVRATARRILIELLYSEDRIAEARAELEKTPESFRQDEAFLLDDARLKLKEGRDAEATGVFDILIQSPTSDPTTFAPYLRHLYDKGEKEKLQAVADLAEQRLLARTGTPSQGAHLVTVLETIGEEARAIRCSEFLYRTYTSDPTVRLVWGVMRQKQGETKDAMRAFGSLPPHMQPRLPLGRLLWLVVKRRLFGPKKKKK